MDKIQQLKITDSEYPKILKEINDPPKVLYYRGNLDALNYAVAIAVIGTRRCSEYGKEMAKNLSEGLAKTGIAIVSGMARGIDTCGHKAALEYGATTIAVLGTGIDDASIYPKQNKKLANDIIDAGGIIISEYDPGTPGLPHHFPERNRIVAGLSQGTLVVEAPFKSGSMITARLALDYNRDVYAVPGSAFSRLSEGCNYLIKNGAKCVTAPEDILDDLSLNNQLELDNTAQNTIELDEEEKAVYEIIENSPDGAHIDIIAHKAKLDTDKASQIVVELMLEDIIKETEPDHYIISK